MPIAVKFIRSFLTRWETRQTVAYIPCRKRNFTGREDPAACGEAIGASGVTVGTGLDLGQQSEADLRRMGLGGAVLDLLRPYLGKRRQEAVAALSARHLTLSEGQADEIDEAAHADFIRRAAARYGAESALPFAECPPEAQAVIVSLFFHLGAPSRYPAGVWAALTAGDWPAAARLLKADASRYRARRRDEGALLGRAA